AVFITSPTYEGRCSDICQIAHACHKRGIPLIVDAAHGAHFGFGKEYDKDGEYKSVPQNSIKQGADIVIHSVHKTLPSMTQTALVHVAENEELAYKVKKYLRIYQTSSPSYVLMSSVLFEKGSVSLRDIPASLIGFRDRINARGLLERGSESPVH
ncbi:MAG: hypothetical protein J6104_04955, partial [Methanomicrobium sp.]|nr:hypothetical protein [Methanomicrobium sp.]